jgi:hypothetical protein
MEAFSRLWLAFWASDASANTTQYLIIYLGVRPVHRVTVTCSCLVVP